MVADNSSWASTFNWYKWHERILPKYKASWGSCVSHPDQLIASNNTTLLSERKDLLTRWTEHFSKLLNDAPEIDQIATNHLEQFPLQNNEMNNCPEIDKISKAIHMLSKGKSPSSDDIHPEAIKRGGLKLISAITEITQKVWKIA